MARPVMLGNGALTVGLNEYGMVHDFYYPYVGLDNLTTARSTTHKIGVWVDGTFSWIDDGTWETSVDFNDDALISDIKLSNSKLEVQINFTDFVDHQFNAFCRLATVNNTSSKTRNIRFFMHQVFQISRGGRGDTALFVPDENYLLDYKGRCSLLVFGQQSDGQLFDQFAVGNYGIEGKEGTFKDAEDGELSGSAVEHGGVDTVMRFSLDIEADSSKTVQYWIVAADSQFEAEKIHKKIKDDSILNRLEDTKQYWHNWLATASNGLHLIDKQYLTSVTKSLLIIKAHIDIRGGIIASCDSSIYNYGRDYYSYVWPRDGAYAIWPLIRLGFKDEPKAFFEFCRDILTEGGYLSHKYQPDKAIGSTWHPLLHGKHSEKAIQEDESAIIIFMLNQYLLHTNDIDFVRGLYDTLIKPIADFLDEFMDEQTNLPHASYDLWEMKFGTSTYTTAVTYRALINASQIAERFEYPDDSLRWKQASERIAKSTNAFVNPESNSLRQGFLLDPENGLQLDNTLDSSAFYGAYMFELPLPDETTLSSTVKLLEERLLDSTPSKGLPRFEHDGYFLSSPEYMGNPWIVTTLWYAQYRIQQGDTEGAKHYLSWVQERAMPSGVLPEQVDPINGAITSVTPLVWSHAELINTILDLVENSKPEGNF